MSNPIKEMFIRLEHTQGHNKFYEVWLEPTGQLYKVMFQYGRIGTSGVMGTKTPNLVSHGQATQLYSNLIAEKQAKGYQKTGTKKQPIPLTPMVPITDGASSFGGPNMATMQPTADHVSALEDYIKSDEWMAQEKMNGKLIRFVVDGNGVATAYNKLTKMTQMPDAICEEAFKAVKKLIIDGELIGSTFYVFDMLQNGSADLKKLDAVSRFNHLAGCCKNFFGKNIQLVGSAYDEHSKRELVKKLQKKNMEGVIFKRKAAVYLPGKTENLGKTAAVKIKFWREVSALVLEWNQKNSIQLALKDGVSTKRIGNVTVPEKYKSSIKPGSIVRVKYLYATKDSILFQPSLDPDDNGDVVRDDLTYPDHLGMLKYEGKPDEGEQPKLKRNIIV